MGRFYETTATPTVDYSAEFPFTELFQAYKYKQDRSDQAYKDLGLAWDELLKVGYIPGGADEEYVKTKRSEFENLYKTATAKGNLANNYNWIQQQIGLIGKDPNLIDIHRSYLGGNEKIKNDQALKEKGQFKDHLSPDNYGWDTRKSHIFGSKQGDFTTPWLEWRPTALSYFNDIPETTKTGQQGRDYLSGISADNASDFAATPEGNLAIDEHIRMGVYTEGLDPKDPNFRNDIAYRILEAQADEVWKRAEANDPNKKNKNNRNNNTDAPPVISTVANPYYDVLSDIYRPSFDGENNKYTNSENIQMINGAQLTQTQVDDIMGIKQIPIKDTDGTITGYKRVVNLGKSTYLDVGSMGGGVFYSYNDDTGEYAVVPANSDQSKYNGRAQERQAYDIQLLTHFYEQGWVQKIMNEILIGNLLNEGFNNDIKTYVDQGLSKNQAIRRATFDRAKEKIQGHKDFVGSRELLLQNGVDPLMDEYIKLYETHTEHLNSLDPDDDKIAGLMSKFQHNIQSLEGLDVEFRVNDTDDNTFLTYGFNADGSAENRLAVRGYAIVTEDELEDIMGEDAWGLAGNDFIDQLVDRAGVIKMEYDGGLFDGDNSTYKIPLYIPVEISHSRMEEYNNGRISSSEGSDGKIRERKTQFNTYVDLNVRGNYAQMQQRSLEMIGTNNAAQLKVNMHDGDVSNIKSSLVSSANEFKNSTTKNAALQEIDDVFAALSAHHPTIFTGAINGTLDADYKAEILKKYPTMTDAMEAYKVLSVTLGDKSWNHQTLNAEEIEQNYQNVRMGGSIGQLDPNTLQASYNGSTYIDATKPGYNVITDVKTYKEVAANEVRNDVPIIDITDQSGDDAVITNTNYTVKNTVYSPKLTASAGANFNALLGDIGTNVTITGAHRTKAYNDALALKLGHTSPGYHVACQALDLAPDKAVLNWLNKNRAILGEQYGIHDFAEEGKGTANHHIHLEFIR